MKRKEEQYLKQLAAELLIVFGNPEPSSRQLELAKEIVGKVAIEQRMLFGRQLTMREACCLYFAALGKTADETAEFLQIKKSTVNSHRKKIKRKLACNSMAQAVFKGIRYGYVHPQPKDPEGLP